MSDEQAVEALWEKIRDDIPESFWRVHVWREGPTSGVLDVADRKRLALRLIAATDHDPRRQKPDAGAETEAVVSEERDGE